MFLTAVLYKKSIYHYLTKNRNLSLLHCIQGSHVYVYTYYLHKNLTIFRLIVHTLNYLLFSSSPIPPRRTSPPLAPYCTPGRLVNYKYEKLCHVFRILFRSIAPGQTHMSYQILWISLIKETLLYPEMLKASLFLN